MNRHLIRAAANRICIAAITTISLVSLASALDQQRPGVPRECAGMSGAALDKCVHDHTTPQMTQSITPIQQSPQLSAPVNCEKVLAADKAFCVWRNQAIVDCRRAASTSRQQDFNLCINTEMERGPKPGPADCSQAKSRQLAALCPLRNRNYKACGADPLTYFACLTQPSAKK